MYGDCEYYVDPKCTILLTYIEFGPKDQRAEPVQVDLGVLRVL